MVVQVTTQVTSDIVIPHMASGLKMFEGRGDIVFKQVLNILRYFKHIHMQHICHIGSGCAKAPCLLTWDAGNTHFTLQPVVAQTAWMDGSRMK